MPLALSRRRAALAVGAAVTLLTGLFVATTRSPADAALTLLSQGRPATASSTENAASPASAAVDGNPGTRWSSAFGDPQWLQVDLGATATIGQVDAQLGGGLRARLPDPGLGRRHRLDDHLRAPPPAPAARRRWRSPAPAGTCG